MADQFIPIPHLSLPLRFITLANGDKAMAVVEQDSYEEVRDCVEAVLRYEVGQRPEMPEFGIADPLFSQGPIVPEPIINSIAAWEPRAKVDLKVEIDTVEELVQNLTLTISDDSSGGVNA